MARKGITYDMVSNAAQAIKARGAEPTISAIRLECGNEGSYSTISAHLAKWRLEIAEMVSIRELPGEVEAKGMEAITTLWNMASKVANEGMNAVRQESSDEKKRLGKELDDAAEEISALEKGLADSEKTNLELRNYMVTLEKKAASLQGELDATKELYKQLLGNIKQPAVPGKTVSDTKPVRPVKTKPAPENKQAGTH